MSHVSQGKSSCVRLTSSHMGKLRLRGVKALTQHPRLPISPTGSLQIPPWPPPRAAKLQMGKLKQKGAVASRGPLGSQSALPHPPGPSQMSPHQGTFSRGGNSSGWFHMRVAKASVPVSICSTPSANSVRLQPPAAWGRFAEPLSAQG